MVDFNRADVRERVRIGMRIAEQFGLDVDETISLTVPVADLVNPNLFEGYPKGAMARTSSGAGGVGTNVQCILQSRPDRGIIYHVTGVHIGTVITGNTFLRIGNAALAAPGETLDKAYTDSRDAGIPNMFTGDSTPLTAAVEGTPIALYDLSTVEAFFLPLDIVLAENGFVIVQNGTANEALDASWRWTEYLLEDR